MKRTPTATPPTQNATPGARQLKNLGQLNLNLFVDSCPLKHCQTVVKNQFGEIFFYQNTNRDFKQILAIKKGDLAHLESNLKSLIDQYQVYYTPNEFSKRRETNQTAKINALFVDLDKKLFKNKLEYQPYNWVNEVNRVSQIEKINLFIEKLNLPLPGLIVFTGNGYHLYWLLENESYHCLRYWQLLEKDLVELLKPIGADPACTDVTRILRLAGTRHQNGEQVKLYTLSLAKDYWKLRELYPLIYDSYKQNIIIPKAPPQQQQQIRARKREKYNPGWKGINSFYKVVLEDLVEIAKAQPKQKIPVGYRDLWLYDCAVALSYICNDLYSLSREIENHALKYTDLPTKEYWRTTSTVRKRAARYYQEYSDYFHGILQEKPQNPRYQRKVKSIHENLEAIIPDSLYDDLRAILPSSLRKIRKHEHNHNTDPTLKRNLRSTTTKTDRQANRLKARFLATQGLTQTQIARELGVTRQTIWNWLKRG